MAVKFHEIAGQKAPTNELGYFQRKRTYYYGDGLSKYDCYHNISGVPETEPLWFIWKNVYENGLLVKREGPLNGAVNTEAVIAALAWNI